MENNDLEIDLQRLIRAVLKKLWLVLLSTILGGVLAFLVTYFLITPKYESSAMFYVNNNSLSVGDASFSLSSSDITASKSLVDSYIVILNARSTLNDVIDYAEVDRDYTELRGMMEAAAVNSTEIFEVVITSTDPGEAKKIADAIAYILPKRISSIIEGTSAKIVDSAVTAARPSSPSYFKNTALGLMLGMMFALGIILVKELLDVTIKEEEDIEQVSKYPILASVPDMAAQWKGGYYTKESAKKAKKNVLKTDETFFVGSNVNFAASEAYKLLRTKVEFSFADQKKCYIIGVTSAIAGEGKSVTSSNLAYSLAQLGKRVLLVDCDMRKPTISNKLHIKKTPGLSNYLTKNIDISEIIQTYADKGEKVSFNVIASGNNPPNPVELLSSERMNQTMEALKGFYDYIILDLPPITEVSDAMAVSKFTDGTLITVRQNYCNRIVLSSALRQFEFVDAKILGIVVTCAKESAGYYSKKYKKYYYTKNEK